MTPRALAITGPTTSGKTAVGVALAHRLRGEVISMDSRQVYRGMDIGTDKVGGDERRGIPHHGIDLVDPDERYSAGQFARDARRWIDDIEGRGHVPILVGGTGFFLRSLLEPIFREPPLDPARRSALRSYLATRPLPVLERWVGELDPERAAVAVEGGRQRLLRALEGVVPDALKRSLVSGLGSVLLSEDGLRSLLLDKNLPKEAVGLLVGQADVMRREILRIVSREIRIFLENMDFGGEIAKILTALSFEIKMEVRFVANDQAVRPKTRSRVKVKRVRDGKEIDLGEDDLEGDPLSEDDEERDAEEPSAPAPAPPHVGQPPKKRRWALRRMMTVRMASDQRTS